jgi:hypothetical protein
MLMLIFLFTQSEIEIDDEVHIPCPTKILLTISDDILEKSFHFSFKSTDHNFLSVTPPGDHCSVKTTLWNLLANAIHGMLLHEYKISYVKEKELCRFIYDLDDLTPTKHFMAPPRPNTTQSEGKHKCTSKRRMPLMAEMALSDGEVEEVTLVRSYQ